MGDCSQIPATPLMDNSVDNEHQSQPDVVDVEDGATEMTQMVDLTQSKMAPSAEANQGKGDKDAKEGEAPSFGDECERLEKEPLRSDEAKEEITVEIGEERKEGEQKSPSPLPPKKGCDVRCLVIGILVLVIMVGGAAVAILAHRFKTESSFEFAFASYYGDNMVLQRAPLKAVVWGYAPVLLENTTVTVLLKGGGGGGEVASDKTTFEYKTTVKNTMGGMMWRVILDEVSDSSPFTITATLEDDRVSPQKIQIKNVLFGDVWICAGQENMQFSVDKLLNGSDEVEAVDDLQRIRLFSLFPVKSNSPSFNIRGIQLPWSLPSKQSLAGANVPELQSSSHFSAICWLFGRQLYSRLQYPVGLISVTYSGSMIEHWISPLAREKCAIAETHSSSKIWNSMVHPLLDLSHYGLIWYQGEKDAMDGPHNYDCAMTAMISQWREELYRRTQGSTDPMLPVGIVQLGPNREASHLTYGYADIRWRQTANYGFVPNPLLKKAFLATAIDLPDINSTYGSILPRFKHDISNRLVLGALAIAYRQKDIQFQGPLPSNYTISLHNHELTLYFDLSSIKVSDTAQGGFEICCSDNQTLFCPSSFIKVSYAPGREWVSASIANHSSNAVSLSWSNCSARHVVGLRYLWRETPCAALHACPIYGARTDLPMGPYIRFGLHDDGLTYQLDREQVDLI